MAKLTTTFEHRLPGPSGHSQTPDSLSIAGPGHPRPGAGPRTSGPQVHGTPWVRVHPSGDALCLHPSLPLPLSLSRGLLQPIPSGKRRETQLLSQGSPANPASGPSRRRTGSSIFTVADELVIIAARGLFTRTDFRESNKNQPRIEVLRPVLPCNVFVVIRAEPQGLPLRKQLGFPPSKF